MFSCSSGNMYESEYIRSITDDTIRPGGYKLTDRAIEFCGFKKEHRVLDIGCGLAATIEYLQNKFALEAIGLDASDKLLGQAKARNPNLNLVKGIGEELSFEDQSMDRVLCECTLSLMSDKEKVLEEVYRVLKTEGYVIITDVYARKPDFIEGLDDINIKTCIKGAHNINDLKEALRGKGFFIELFEDHTDCLKQMIVDIIFEFGTMAEFWEKAGNCDFKAKEFQESIVKSKIGYFLLIARK